MRFKVLAALSAAACLFAAAPAPAAFQYRLTTPTTTVTPGVPFTVSVFLDFTAGGDNTNYLTNGLITGWTGLRYSGSPVLTYAASPAAPTNPVDFSNNADFNDVTARGPTFAGFPNTGLTNILGLQAQVTGSPATAASANNTTRGGTATSLFIASFNVKAALPGGTATLNAFLINPSSQNIVSSTGTVLDTQTTAGTLAITVVPEPTSMALVGMAATGFVGAIWRKRRQARASVANAETAV